ncbi:sensor histidine kinase [Streptomyces sp. MS06]|uniref:sensor histidine kinase n=1 Tax=Streptomyces sp. MS06 TaxID=3385974 RepID=UPI0039A2E4EF
MERLRSVPRRAAARLQAHRAGRADRVRAEECRDEQAAKAAEEEPGPPFSGFTLLPWLLMGMGAFSNIFRGEAPNPWIGSLGLLAFNSLYVYVSFRAFDRTCRGAASTRAALVLLALVTCGLAIGYGGSWLMFFPLLGLATGAVMRGPRLRATSTGVMLLALAVSCFHEGWDGIGIGYATWISTMVTAAILSLSEAVRELRAAREELAHRAVEKERLRFSRDLHDLLGHTLSVIVVKSEAARRLAARDLDAALVQVSDIESVGRQALTEIREAVTGYREGTLTTELDRARSALTAAGVEPSVRQSGPPPAPRTAALLGWVVREAVTNVVRHSTASRCEITVDGTPERARLTVADNGADPSVATNPSGTAGPSSAADPSVATNPSGTADPAGGGTGLAGLAERLAAAGGSLRAGPSPRGFTVTAELPVEDGGPPAGPAPAPLPTALAATGATASRDRVTAPRGR